MPQAFISPEEVHTDESDDHAEQQRRRQYEDAMATVTEDTIVEIVTDALRYDPASELREYIRQTLAEGEALDYMPHSTGLRFAAEVASRVALAISGQVSMRLVAQEGRS
jgi:hypothetical protein